MPKICQKFAKIAKKNVLQACILVTDESDGKSRKFNRVFTKKFVASISYESFNWKKVKIS